MVGDRSRGGAESKAPTLRCGTPGFPAFKLFTLKMANKPKYGQCGQEQWRLSCKAEWREQGAAGVLFADGAPAENSPKEWLVAY